MPFEQRHLFIQCLNALIVEEENAGLLSPVSNIALLFCYTTFLFTGFSSQFYIIPKQIAREEKKITDRWHYPTIGNGSSSWNKLQTEKILCETTQNSLGKAQKEAEMRQDVLATLTQSFTTRTIDSKQVDKKQ